MAEHDDGSPKWLLCGVHTSHSAAEEQRWASLDFQAETERQQKLFPSLIAYLKQKGKISPGPYPPVPHSYNNQRIYEVKQHFALLRRRIPRDKYLEQVSIYERALNGFLAYPPCRRDLKGFPLLPMKIVGLVQIADLPTPRFGGRHVSRTVQDRNLRIAELVKADNTHLNICLILDK